MIDYPYFKENYKVIPIDLNKQQALDTDPTRIQQINFTANLDEDGNTKKKEAKKAALDFSQGTVNVL